MMVLHSELFIAILLVVLNVGFVKKVNFHSPDGVSITFMKDDLGEKQDTFITQSLWNNNQRSKHSFRSYHGRSSLLYLLLCCGDIETCPGPTYTEEFQSFQKQKGFKIFHQNIRGLLNNIEQVRILLEPHILTLSETHIVDDSPYDIDDLYKISGYRYIKRNRQSGLGGVSMYIKENITWKRRSQLEKHGLECIWLEVINKNTKSFLITAFYRPPEGSLYLSKSFDDDFHDIIMNASLSNKEIILLGDLNVNYLSNNDNKNLKSILTLFGFKQLINEATRTTETSSH